jgi:hypothetical protein
MDASTHADRHPSVPGPSPRPASLALRIAGRLAALVLLAGAAGCGGNQAACADCRITVDSADTSWSFEVAAGGAATADTPLAPSAPVLFIVYGADGVTPIPGADITLFTSGNASALVAPADRATVQAVNGGNIDGDLNGFADYLDEIAYLVGIGWTELDFTNVLNPAKPDVVRRGIFPTRTDAHGQVEVIPDGWLPGCPAIAVGGNDVTLTGELGVAATLSDDFNIWTAKWTLTCKAP